MNSYLSLEQSRELLPGRPSLATVRRWAKTGVDGHILRTRKIGRRRFTCPEWIAQFVGRFESADSVVAHHEAERLLDEMGVR